MKKYQITEGCCDDLNREEIGKEYYDTIEEAREDYDALCKGADEEAKKEAVTGHHDFWQTYELNEVTIDEDGEETDWNLLDSFTSHKFNKYGEQID